MYFCDYFVTPHVGVWIETRNYRKKNQEIMVTPHVGVLIETWLITLV